MYSAAALGGVGAPDLRENPESGKVRKERGGKRSARGASYKRLAALEFVEKVKLADSLDLFRACPACLGEDDPAGEIGFRDHTDYVDLRN
jgi:hypothetical protein